MLVTITLRLSQDHAPLAPQQAREQARSLTDALHRADRSTWPILRGAVLIPGGRMLSLTVDTLGHSTEAALARVQGDLDTIGIEMTWVDVTR